MMGGISALATMLAILVLIGMANTRSKPILRQITLHLSGRANGSPPMRIALLADIHLGNGGYGASPIGGNC